MLDVLIEIKEIIAVIISLILGVIILIRKLIKAIKSKTKLTNLISIEAKVLELVNLAEGYSNYSGEEKKEWVKTKANQYAIEESIDYDNLIVDKIIESLIDLSKKVNRREKEKQLL